SNKGRKTASSRAAVVGVASALSFFRRCLCSRYSDITSATVTSFSPDNQLRRNFLSNRLHIMVNAIKGVFISCDIPMAQYIINMNASLPASDKFIIHILDSTHMFVQPQVEQMIRSQIAKFREDNTYVKPN
ncbi:hypothetical protein S83_052464, partial [Arachis hypogaea]